MKLRYFTQWEAVLLCWSRPVFHKFYLVHFWTVCPKYCLFCFQLDSSKDSTAWKMSTCGVISGPYFPVFRLNTRKCGPEITPYLDTFQAVQLKLYLISVCSKLKYIYIIIYFHMFNLLWRFWGILFQKLPWNDNSI